MIDQEKMTLEETINGLQEMIESKKYIEHNFDGIVDEDVCERAIDRLKEQEKENKALRLLVEWAEECGFGFDQFQDKYERYKDEVKGMKYIDGMIHVAKRTLEEGGEAQ